MRITVSHGIDDLAKDMRSIAVRARKDMIGVVSRGIRVGNSVARDYAKESGGSHAGVGKNVQPYVKVMTAEMQLFGALGLIAGEYGPEARSQGLLADVLENGSRTSPAHHNLDRSLDVIGPAFVREVRDTVDDWFWPGGR